MEDLRVTRRKIGSCNIISEVLCFTYLIYLHCQKPYGVQVLRVDLATLEIAFDPIVPGSGLSYSVNLSHQYAYYFFQGKWHYRLELVDLLGSL